ncbi:MAG: acetoin utilization protein AcuC [Acetobacterales bacterium]
MAPRLIGSEIYRRSSYGGKHPLSIPRVSTTLDLIRAMGWFDPARYIDSPRATVAQLERFHAADYVACLQRAECDGRVTEAEAERYHIGRFGNPVYREVFSRPATAAGASILAAQLLASGEAQVVHSPAGGTHHGRRDRASGFCYLNDPVLGILFLLDAGVERVFYLDVDAHHGDGVEDALAEDARVFTLSVHEDGRWPGSGRAVVRSPSAYNLPVPAGFNDSELAFLMQHVVDPLLRRFDPQVVVMQCGADALADDPLSKLSLSNGALWDAVRQVRQLAPRLLVLGGGGYNPWSVARCWAGVWAVLDGRPIPQALPEEARGILGALRWDRAAGRTPQRRWLDTLADPPNAGPVREVVRRLADIALGVTSRPGPGMSPALFASGITA